MDKFFCAFIFWQIERKSFIEKQIGYKFKNIDFLVQAFTTPSYSKENNIEDYESLRLVGIDALDLYLTRLLTRKFKPKNNSL